MKEKFGVAIVFSAAIVISAYLLGHAFVHRNQSESKISVVGLGKEDFTSDLIVWEGRFSASDTEIGSAYSKIDRDRKIIEKYLSDKGIDPDDMVFSAVTTNEITRPVYSDDGRYLYDKFLGYQLTQNVILKSKKVQLVEKIAREITELLNKGIKFYSEPPRYYYTKLEDLKLEMISRATENARQRAEKIAQQAGVRLGKLKQARMGVFQITGQYSDEDYSWGGTFNTSSKDKTARITMKLVYDVD